MLAKKPQGFTMIELLVVLVITSLLLASLLALYLAASLAYQRSVNNARLNETLQSVMDLMTTDIRRAGFWENASTDINSDSNHNPFLLNDITLNAAGDCILFTYDRNGLGSLPSIGSVSDDEHYGFRLMNNAIQARPSGAPYNCGASASAWSNLTDSNVIHITQLNFTLGTKTLNISGASGTPTLTVRTVNVSITGQLASDSTVTKTMTQLVRVRNDNYAP